ncbi:hypothetical protein K435DRAFT_592954, partial [Dendrothele bispora CBS 962.96]
LGHYGNAASLRSIARTAGVAEGSVPLFTERCFTAIESLQEIFVRKLTREEKEVEKCWIDERLGFRGTWREGWVMYDGTIVPLFRKPGLNGDAYFTRKSNYGLNLQIGNVPSTLRIVDYAHGLTGSAHDANAFQYTAASVHADWFFEGEEFAWGDSAYGVTPRMISVHKKPASQIYENLKFDTALSRLRVESEHCLGSLKGRFQCLKGLRVGIDSKEQHYQATRWMTVPVILHNMILDVEG